MTGLTYPVQLADNKRNGNGMPDKRQGRDDEVERGQLAGYSFVAMGKDRGEISGHANPEP